MADTLAYTIFPGNAESAVIFVCDHAGREIPAGYGTLGLEANIFERHIAYDIGAAAMTAALAQSFGATAILGRYSRLFIDLNRGADDPTLIMRISDGEIIPGNNGLTAAEAERRIAMTYAPYHAAIAREIERVEARGLKPILISVHSFTPSWRGVGRPWEISILSSPKDRRLADALLRALRKDGRHVIGDNEPYSGALVGDTMAQHGLSGGRLHALIEIRQDLIGDHAGVEALKPFLQRVIHEAITDCSAGHSQPAIADPTLREAVEAAAFRKLVAHLRARHDVQNIDLMNLAGFCRNCLGDWYREAADARGLAMSKDDGRAQVYGMAYAEWKARYQREAKRSE